MKPSHLAALAIAALTGGLIGGQAAPSEVAAMHAIGGIPSKALPPIPLSLRSGYLLDTRCFTGIDRHPASWQHLNQRQIRLRRRRKNASGNKKAFV